jgi:hypothetical protein
MACLLHITQIFYIRVESVEKLRNRDVKIKVGKALFFKGV